MNDEELARFIDCTRTDIRLLLESHSDLRKENAVFRQNISELLSRVRRLENRHD